MKSEAQVLECKLGAAEGEKSMLQKEQGALEQTVTDLQRQVGDDIDNTSWSMLVLQNHHALVFWTPSAGIAEINTVCVVW